MAHIAYYRQIKGALYYSNLSDKESSFSLYVIKFLMMQREHFSVFFTSAIYYKRKGNCTVSLKDWKSRTAIKFNHITQFLRDQK